MSSSRMRNDSRLRHGTLATSPPETTTSRTPGVRLQVVDHRRRSRSTGLSVELELVDLRGGVADQVHPGAVPAVLRAGGQQLGEHLGRVAVGQPLDHPHLVLVQRVAGGVRVRRPLRVAGRRPPAACSGGPGRRRTPRCPARRVGTIVLSICGGSSIDMVASSRLVVGRGRRRSARRRRSPSTARSCRTFLTQCTRCHCASPTASRVTSRQPGSRVQSGSTSSWRAVLVRLVGRVTAPQSPSLRLVEILRPITTILPDEFQRAATEAMCA